jgi:phage tail sheath protein FI
MPGLADEPKLSLHERLDVASAGMLQAEELQDRLVVLDVLAEKAAVGALQSSTDDSIQFANDLRQTHADPKIQRCAAIYHPSLCVEDPLGGVRSPLKTIPPSGHVAGVMSRTDRERGAHYTPANTPIHDAVDLEPSIDRRDQAQLGDAGVNVLRSIPGRGPNVWGGRTLELTRDGRFVGHRRFIHRLVRVMRRVAEPLVFDTNGPELWLALLHALGTVLLEAFRSGALQGDSPEQAYRVRCDERTNPRDAREQGRVLCEVDLALAAPMEFIQLRVALSQTGRVEVFEA